MQEQVGGEQPVRHVVAAAEKMNAVPDVQSAREQLEFAATVLADDDEARPAGERRQPGQRGDGAVESFHAEAGTDEEQESFIPGPALGGYAAILFGCLAKADEVHAFSSQTFLSLSMRLRHGDKRWTGLILKRRFSPGWSAYSDLRAVVRQKNPRTRLFLYYSTDNRADPAHANHLADLPGVQLRAQAEGGHRVVTHLKNSGELERILRTAVDGRAVPWPDG